MIQGYSERGLVNALFEALDAHENRCELLADLLENCCWVRPMRPGQRMEIKRPITGFEVFIEPSLSMFGEPDAVLFVNTRERRDAQVFFIEAKRETFLGSAMSGVNRDDAKALETHLRKYSSSVLHELFVKGRFHDLVRRDDGPELLRRGLKVFPRDRKKGRSIGRDPMVLALAHRLSQCPAAYFVALTTDSTPAPSQIWNVAEKVRELMVQIDETNRDADPGFACDGYTKPLCGWVECSLILSWLDIYAWAEQARLNRITGVLRDNLPKLETDPLGTDDPRRTHILEHLRRGGLTAAGKRKSDHRVTLNGGDRRARCTVGFSEGLGGGVRIDLRYVKRLDHPDQVVSGKALFEIDMSSPPDADDTVKKIQALAPSLAWSRQAPS